MGRENISVAVNDFFLKQNQFYQKEYIFLKNYVGNEIKSFQKNFLSDNTKLTLKQTYPSQNKTCRKFMALD